MNRFVTSVLLPLLFGGLAACQSGGTASAPVSEAVRARICQNPKVDHTSRIYLARTAAGKAHRLVATPAAGVTETGNQVYDLSGELLGETTGDKFPWNDAALVAKEEARLTALMDGAKEEQLPVADCPPR